MTTLSLIIPCYNEAGNLPKLVERCAEAFGNTGTEVILVDNGSTDETPALLDKILRPHDFLSTIRVEINQGYGFGVLQGLRAATGEILAWTHADLQTDPGDALKGMAKFVAADDPSRLFVKGRRFGRPFRDRIFSWCMALYEGLLLRSPMWDINAQPTMFHRRTFESWTNPPHDFSLDLYAYYMALRRGLTVERIPVYFGKRESGVGSNDTFADKIRFSLRTLRYSRTLSRRLRRESS